MLHALLNLFHKNISHPQSFELERPQSVVIFGACYVVSVDFSLLLVIPNGLLWVGQLSCGRYTQVQTHSPIMWDVSSVEQSDIYTPMAAGE